jgi:hypothetical protein
MVKGYCNSNYYYSTAWYHEWLAGWLCSATLEGARELTGWWVVARHILHYWLQVCQYRGPPILSGVHIHVVSYVMRLLKTKWVQEHSARKRGIG